MVITGLTRNQLGSNPPRVRISPSPPKNDRFRPVVFLSIAKAMVYHHVVRVYLITEGVYHQPQAAFSFAMKIYNSNGIDDMQDSVLMIYTASPWFLWECEFIRKNGKNIFFIVLTQRITVILIQWNDGYFIPKISILRTFR